MTRVDGEVARGFEPVGDAFRQVLAEQTGTGAAMAAWHDGRWVARLYGGYTDASRTRPWRPDSIVMPYSVTKPFAAVCLLLLVNRGHVGLDEPMQTYWPEFVAPTTVRQVLSHQAGVVALDEPLPTKAFYDWNRLCRALAAQEPQWSPGERPGESALFYGHLVGEVVRRVDGRSLGRFLREEITGPLGIDFTIGLGASERSRAVDLPASTTRTSAARSWATIRRCTSGRSATRQALGIRRWSTGPPGAQPRSRRSTGTAPRRLFAASSSRCSTGTCCRSR